MKTKRIAFSVAVAVLVMAFFMSGMAPAKATISNGAAAEVVIGQQNTLASSANQGGSVTANTMNSTRGIFFDGQKLFVADSFNNRVLIYNSIPTSNNAAADVVIGQQDMTSNLANQGGSPAANTLHFPYSVSSDGQKLFIADYANHRVLVYNSIPTSNNASADVVIGQQNMAGGSANQGGSVSANSMYFPTGVYTNGIKLIVTDGDNNRVLIYNTIPTANNAAADVVIGQQNMTSNSANQGAASPTASTLYWPYGASSNGKKLFIADWSNNRVLIYNSIPTASNTPADVVVGQADMTSNAAPASTGANTLTIPSEVTAFGKKLVICDHGSHRVLVYNSIPTSNNASADIVVGQADMSGHSSDQGAAAAANSLDDARAVAFGGTKMFVGDTDNNRVMVYDFGPQYAIGKNKSATLWNGEKMKVKKKTFEFSGKRTDLKKGRVRLMVSGSSKKIVKIKKNGKWNFKYNHKTNGTVLLRFKYYNSSGTLVEYPETYAVEVRHNGSLAPVMLDKSELKPMSYSTSGLEENGPEKVDGANSLR